MGIKGSWKRPRSITREEEDLRWELAEKHISYNTYSRRYNELKRLGLLRRSGRVLK